MAVDLRPAEPEALGGPDQHRIDVTDAEHGGRKDNKKATVGDEDQLRLLADAEPENENGEQGPDGDRPEGLDHRLNQILDPSNPGHADAHQDPDGHGQQEAGHDALEGNKDVLL